MWLWIMNFKVYGDKNGYLNKDKNGNKEIIIRNVNIFRYLNRDVIEIRNDSS